jgi:hypothetical protein
MTNGLRTIGNPPQPDREISLAVDAVLGESASLPADGQIAMRRGRDAARVIAQALRRSKSR